MTIGLKMAEKRHFEKVPDRQQQTTEDRWKAHGLFIVGPELKVWIRQKIEIFYFGLFVLWDLVILPLETCV